MMCEYRPWQSDPPMGAQCLGSHGRPQVLLSPSIGDSCRHFLWRVHQTLVGLAWAASCSALAVTRRARSRKHRCFASRGWRPLPDWPNMASRSALALAMASGGMLAGAVSAAEAA